MDNGTQFSLDVASGAHRKRRHTETNEDSDDDTTDVSAPVNDIYRARQQKKVK